MIYGVAAAVVVVLTVGIAALRRVSLPRRVSLEGIEDDEVVEAYDRLNRWPQFRLLRSIVIRELRRHHPEGVLVDIGCGPGYLLARIATAFPHLSLVGVDIAREMLSRAAGNMARRALESRATFREGDIERLPLDECSVDFVVSTLSLHHWAQPEQALAEIERVLKPGAQFIIFDVRRDSPRLLYLIIRFAQRWILPAALRRIDEPTGSFRAAYTPRELQAMISTTPFEEWRVQPGLFWTFVWGRKGAPT